MFTSISHKGHSQLTYLTNKELCYTGYVHVGRKVVMEGLLTLLGPLGAPVSLIGFLLFMYAYMRKQEAQISADLKQTIDRQKGEIEAYAKEDLDANKTIKELRTENAKLIMDNAVLEGRIRTHELGGK